MQLPENQKKKLQMNHKINSITFGDESQQEVIVHTFGGIDHGEHTIFNMFKKDGKVNEELKYKPEDPAHDYFYFLKIVPHEFMDYIDQEIDYSYSYSLNHNQKTSDNADFSAVTIILDYAPIKMIISRKHREVGQFLINLCSIVGGVFIIYGLLNSFILSLQHKIANSF